MPLFKGHTQRTVNSLAAQVAELAQALEFERSLNEQLRNGMLQVARREIAIPAFEQPLGNEDLAEIYGTDEPPVIQMPDGEYVAPAAFDFERLAQAIMEDGDTGGASGTWES